jgi:hypothetical protein
VDNTKRLLINIAGIMAVSIIGAVLMTGDLGGSRWLKFILCVVFFVAICSPIVSSSRYSCSGTLHRLRKRS